VSCAEVKNEWNCKPKSAAATSVFWGRVTKMSIYFEEIFSRAHINLEKQNKVLDSPIIITGYCIIITNTYFTYIINA